MSDAKKVQREIASFRNFLLLGNIVFDEYRSQPSPEPDIVARRGELAFGIEITEFHREAEKRDGSEEDFVLEKASEIYRSRGGPGIELTAMWTPHSSIQKKDRARLAGKIADVVSRYAPTVEKSLDLDRRDFDDNELMLAIDHTSIDMRPSGSHGHWNAARGGFVPKWEVASLQQEIDRKKGMPQGYLHRYKEIWLLLISVFDAPSSWLEMSDEVRNALYVSSFDRVFLLSSFPHGVIELKLDRSPV